MRDWTAAKGGVISSRSPKSQHTAGNRLGDSQGRAVHSPADVQVSDIPGSHTTGRNYFMLWNPLPPSTSQKRSQTTNAAQEMPPIGAKHN